MASLIHPPTGPMRVKLRGGGGKTKESSGAGNGANGHQPTIRLKVVIRHLPSLLKESEFRDVMSNYINDDTTDFFTWSQGKIPEDRNKAPTPSRCYLKMKDPMQITALSNGLRAHGMFIDSKGNSTIPQMEFSPYQRVPKKVVRIDSRAGAIESDADFQAFIASLHPATVAATTEGGAEGSQPPLLDPHAPAPIPANDPLSVPMPSNEPFEKPKTTPLIEFIRSQKATPAGGSSKPKAVERASSVESSRSSKRLERRARERLAKSKGKERDAPEESKAIEPMALLKRMDSGPPRLGRQGSSGLPPPPPKTVETQPEKTTARDKEGAERSKGRDRDRRRGAAGVAAILQRDLGLGEPIRRSRGRAVAAEPKPTTPAILATPSSTPSLPPNPASASQQPPDSPKPGRPRDRPSRRERRAAKLEREESAASTASNNSNTALPLTPVALLRGSSGLSGGHTAMLLKRESTMGENSSGASNTNASLALNTNTVPQSPMAAPTPPATPTGPRGGLRGGRGRRGGMMAMTNQPPPPPQPQLQINQTPPTGPAAGNGGGGFGGRGRGGRGGRGMFSGGRGRGGGGGGGGPRGPVGAPASNAGGGQTEA